MDARELSALIAAVWAETLGASRVDPDKTFADLGGTSLGANQLVAHIAARLGLRVPVVRVFEYPTLRAFTAFLVAGQPAGFALSPQQQPAHGIAGRRAVPDRAVSTGIADAPPTSSQTLRAGQDIAIVGMACRFPGAASVQEFWRNLLEGRESVRLLSSEELSPEVPAELRNDSRYVRACGVIDEPYSMDAAFFDINPMEAKLIDPQHRVLLETTWEALESAGQPPGHVGGPTAVFAGVEDNSYYKTEILPFPEAEKRAGRFSVMTGNEKDFVAMRIAHKLDLRGPAVSVHTACSTSLVAVIMACRSLRNRECDLAVAGGASVHFPTPEGYYFQEGGVFSPDGHCRPFDEDAQGTIFTDGAGVVALKRIEDAVRERNTIFAVIKGGAINNDGGDKVSFSAPSISGQATCVADALRDAEVDPATLQYLEAHGTATPVGDPIEVEALRQAFGAGLPARQFCGLGSVKSNIGHTTAAAGVASLIKTALALHHGVIPPTLHYRRPNPGLELEASPFYVTDHRVDWPRGSTVRRAGVSSFGIGGTNSHVVLEEAPLLAAPAVGPGRPFEILPVSARTDSQLERLVTALGAEQQPIRDLAYTLQHGRARLRRRAARVRFAAASIEDIVVRQAVAALEDPRLVFMFPGQGAQYIEMGRSLHGALPEFRHNFDRCCELLSRELELDFRSFIFDPSNQETLENTRYTQPALFAIEVSLGRMLFDWGIEPEAMIGHSIGEFAAAHLAGVFSLEDGLKLIAARGRLMADLPRGRMLSVRGTIEAVRAAAGEPIDVASVNSPVHCVLSGESERIAAVQARLEAAGLPCRPLHTSHAFHSSMMDPVVEPFRAIVRTVQLQAPRLRIMSTVTGQQLKDGDATNPDYWAGHLRATVRFSDALFASLDAGDNLFVEVGPRTTLSTLAVQHFSKSSAPAAERVAISMLGEEADPATELGALGSALARMWISGIELPWSEIWGAGTLVPVGFAYPFERVDFRFSEGRQAQRRAVLPAPSAATALAVAAAPPVLAAAPTNSMQDELRADLGALFSEYSGLAIERLDSTFVENGFDSLVLMQIGIELGKRYGVSVSLRDLMNKHNTLNLLAALLAKSAPRARLPQAAAPQAPPPVAPATPATPARAATDPFASAALPAAQFPAMPVNGSAAPRNLSDAAQRELGQMRELLEAQRRPAAPAAAAGQVHAGNGSAGSASLIRARHVLPQEPGASRAAAAADGAQLTASAVEPALSSGAERAVSSTAAQREIFTASVLDPDASRGYNHSISIFLEGLLDRDALYSSLLNLLDRHEALRGRLSPDGLLFHVRERVPFELPLLDLTDLAAAARRKAYERFVRLELDHVFNLVEGALFRATLVKFSAREWVLVFNCHHVVVDGWSLKIILGDLPKLYSAHVKDLDHADLEAPASFMDYLEFAAERELETAEAVRTFWRSTYEHGLPLLDLPIDYPRPRVRTYGSRRQDYRIERRTYERLKEIGAQCGVSQFVTLLSALSVYLYRISGQADHVIGVPAAGQIKSGKAKLLGHDARLMPIRCTIEAGDTFATFSQRVMERFLAAYEHQWITLPELLDTLSVEPDPSRVPLISVMFNFDPGMKRDAFGYSGLRSHHFFNHRNAETFELSINAVVEEQDMVLECAYNAALFDDGEMNRRLAQFGELMQAIGAAPQQPLATLRLLPEDQLGAMDAELNSTALEYERKLCVDELIERSVRRTPGKIAVEFGAASLTYAELWEQSGRIARAVVAAGPGPQRLIGVCLERSATMVAVLLGIWRAGAAFVPLDPTYPLERLRYMIEKSGMRLLLADGAAPASLASGSVRALNVTEILSGTSPPAAAVSGRGSEDLAYVIFTSGSTGDPKGVQVPHRALGNFLHTMAVQSPGISASDRVLAVTTLSFDIAELEIWLPLAAGATTVIADRATTLDGHALIETIRDKRISFLQATPATWRLLLFCGWQGDSGITALCGGEALPRELADELLDRVGVLWNVYGPTETTVWSTIERVERGSVTIGRPIGNTQAYILDAHRNWVPRGTVGELWLGGEGVTHGYLGRPDLTAERFAANPFSGHGKMYRTGDLVRLRLDGRIEYVGRNDFQVKVRGFRIELGDVQRALARHPAIRECVVAVRNRSASDAQLVGYYTTRASASPEPAELRAIMRETAPDYMVPTQFVELPTLPLTLNGKVDHKALPDPFADGAGLERELGQLESALGEHPLLRQAAVAFPPQRAEDTRPVAFVVAAGEREPSVVDLRKHLRSRIAEQLIPDCVITLATLPLTRTRRLDRQALARSLPAVDDAIAAPAGHETAPAERANQRLLMEVWKELLGVPRVDKRDNFFNLGGHSLASIQMIVLVEKRSGYRLNPRHVLLNTLEQLASAMPASLAASSG